MKGLIGFLLCLLSFKVLSNDDVSLTFIGFISPKCGFTTQNNNLTLSSAGFADTQLVIKCNTPMRVSMQSENGGLRHQQGTQLKAYNVNWSIVDANYSKSITAQTLKTAYEFNVDKILFNSVAKLQLELIEPLIYAGDYQDVIRIEMTPSAVSGGVW